MYTVALTTVELAAKRSVNLPGSLGQRLMLINEEIFSNIPFINYKKTSSQEEYKEIFTNLDNLSEKQQATGLPIIIGICMYVCIYVYGYIYLKTCIYINTCIRIYIYI
jgi:hypothetical protein